MSSEETRLWNIQSNLYFHVPMPKVPVPKVPAQSSNINLSIWQTSSDCDPLSIGSWVTQLWCLATQNPSLQTGEVFLFSFSFFLLFLRSSWQHFHSHHLERHWSHLHIQGDQWKSRLWQCWWQWRRWWKLPLDIFAGQPVLEVHQQSEAGEGRKSHLCWTEAECKL